MLYPSTPTQSPFRYLSVKEIGNPYLVIDSFFSDYHTAEAAHLLHRWVRSVLAEKSRINKSIVLELLYFSKQLARLLEAAWLLKEEGSDTEKDKSLSDIKNEALLNPALFHLPHPNYVAWDSFPRHLNRAEYVNPYQVFGKCFRQHDINDWHELLEDLFYAAAHDGPLNYYVQDEDLYVQLRCLFKLIEACQLLKVREIEPFVEEEIADA